jgi:hypothetical protein
VLTRYEGRMRAELSVADRVDSLRAQRGIDLRRSRFLKRSSRLPVFDTERDFPWSSSL